MKLRASILAVLAVLLVTLAGCSQPPTATATSSAPSTTGSTTTAAATTTTQVSTSSQTPAPTGVLRVHYVDVGQGDGIIWQLPDGSLVVYDCGDAATSATNPVTKYLRTVLNAQPGTRIRALVASHGHLDHIGGCDEVFEDYVIENVYDTWYLGADRPASYKTFQSQVQAEGAVLHVLVDDPSLTGDVVFQRWDTIPIGEGATAQVLWPNAAASSWDHIADKSIVVRLSFGSTSFCFQGDIETSQENTLASDSRDLSCDVYLMGHHGSNAASGTAWLNKLKPTLAPVSFGETSPGTNQYNHPRPEALCRVQSVGAKVYATHRLGSITIQSDGATLAVSPDQAETKDYCQAGDSYWT